MALIKGENSYETLESANSYFEDRLDAAAWSDAPELQRSQAMVTAASMLDNLTWTGAAVSESQPLAFPRNGQYFDPRIGATVSLNGQVPKRVITAQYELAYHLLNNDGLLDDTGSVSDLSLGSIKLSDVKSPKKLPSIVYSLIRPLLFPQGGSVWWRAN